MDHWVFGYGSLIYKVDFPILDRRRALIRGWARRFWQGSHDHRGTEDAPGRVVTLVPAAGAICEGVAYRISESVFDHLDHREKNGYERVDTRLVFCGGEEATGTTYIADAANHAFLGDAPLEQIAAHIDRSHGPSGSNREYLLHLADALRDMGVDDEHVFGLERMLLAIDHRRAP
ncbi:MAG: gamma-glutamylcyclotransferase [Pseudomonadota bacterium]